VGGLTIALVSLLSGESRSHSKEPADLRPVALIAHDLGYDERRSRLEIEVHNTGGRLVVIDQAEVTVRRVFELERCAAQGDLPLSNVYGTALPADAKPGEAITIPLHQQVGPDEADRFALALSVDREAARSATLFLYEIEVALRNDGGRPVLSLGKALISLPHMPFPAEYFWDGRTAEVLREFHAAGEPFTPRQTWGYAMPCWQANTKTLQRALASPAARSRGLDVVAKTLATPSFSALE